MRIPEGLKELLRSARGLSFNSKEVEEGYIFFAIKGSSLDGHDFVEEAVKRGASAVVVEKEVNLPKEVPLFRVEDTRKALGLCADEFFKSPSKELKVVGITGTNGKTTTACILEAVINSSKGRVCGLVGTLEYRLGDSVLGKGRTTPDAITWHRSLRLFSDYGAGWVAAEVSSHALDQHRVFGTRFHGAIFTNLTQDHLDYHADMEDYFAAKKRLFIDYESEIKVVNTDDTYGARLARELGKEAITYGKRGSFKIVEFNTSLEGSLLGLEYEGKLLSFKTSLVGEFQAYNLAAAIAYLLSAGFDESDIKRGIENLKVPGRFETYRRGEVAVVIDYAHTPDAMENVLKTAKRLARGRVIAVFGAGGNRDRSKRALMGRTAESLADLIIITSDNPRWEKPEEIAEDILGGIRDRSRVLMELDRSKAIKEAVSRATKGDIVLIMGKGHEDYQEIKGIKYPFSDREVVLNILSGGRNAL